MNPLKDLAIPGKFVGSYVTKVVLTDQDRDRGSLLCGCRFLSSNIGFVV